MNSKIMDKSNNETIQKICLRVMRAIVNGGAVLFDA